MRMGENGEYLLMDTGFLLRGQNVLKLKYVMTAVQLCEYTKKKKKFDCTLYVSEFFGM